MQEKHIGGVESNENFYEGLEGFALEKIRGHLQDLLEQEIGLFYVMGSHAELQTERSGHKRASYSTFNLVPLLCF